MRIPVAAASAAALSLFVLSPVALAADAPPSAPSAAAPAAAAHKPVADGDRIICKSQQATGSRLPTKKVCHSKREWDDITAETQQMLQSDPHQNNPTEQSGLMTPPQIKCCAAPS